MFRMWWGSGNNSRYHNRTNIAFHCYERMTAIDISALVISLLGFHGNLACAAHPQREHLIIMKTSIDLYEQIMPLNIHMSKK